MVHNNPLPPLPPPPHTRTQINISIIHLHALVLMIVPAIFANYGCFVAVVGVCDASGEMLLEISCQRVFRRLGGVRCYVLYRNGGGCAMRVRGPWCCRRRWVKCAHICRLRLRMRERERVNLCKLNVREHIFITTCEISKWEFAVFTTPDLLHSPPWYCIKVTTFVSGKLSEGELWVFYVWRKNFPCLKDSIIEKYMVLTFSLTNTACQQHIWFLSSDILSPSSPPHWPMPGSFCGVLHSHSTSVRLASNTAQHIPTSIASAMTGTRSKFSQERTTRQNTYTYTHATTQQSAPHSMDTHIRVFHCTLKLRLVTYKPHAYTHTCRYGGIRPRRTHTRIHTHILAHTRRRGALVAFLCVCVCFYRAVYSSHAYMPINTYKWVRFIEIRVFCVCVCFAQENRGVCVYVVVRVLLWLICRCCQCVGSVAYLQSQYGINMND